MFTGLVESIGVVQDREECGSGIRMSIAAPFASELSIGESVCVQGACLSVTHQDQKSFTTDISPETLSRTMFGQHKVGTRLNLERAMLPTTRIGGHFVTGHVDCLGEIVSREARGEFVQCAVSIPEKYIGLVVEKGSIAVDGISLTVNALLADSQIEVMLIPHTMAATTASQWSIGSCVHLECDLIAKQIKQLTDRYIHAGKNMSTVPHGSIIGAFE